MHSDIIIIGAGPGGDETALGAAHRGKSVTLFNGGALGGTCLNAASFTHLRAHGTVLGLVFRPLLEKITT